MKVFAIANKKGGVGKTMLSINLAYELSKKGNTLLIDLDPQAHSTTVYFGKEQALAFAGAETIFQKPPQLSFCKALIGGPGGTESDSLFIAVASPKLYEASERAKSPSFNKREYLLHKALTASEYDFKYVVIDCPPESQGILQKNALAAADEIIIPLLPDKPSIDSVCDMFPDIIELNEQTPRIHCVMNGWRESEKSNNRDVMYWLDVLKESAQQALINLQASGVEFTIEQIRIPHRTAARQAQSYNMPIELVDKKSDALGALNELVAVLTKVQRKKKQ